MWGGGKLDYQAREGPAGCLKREEEGFDTVCR